MSIYKKTENTINTSLGDFVDIKEYVLYDHHIEDCVYRSIVPLNKSGKKSGLGVTLIYDGWELEEWVFNRDSKEYKWVQNPGSIFSVENYKAGKIAGNKYVFDGGREVKGVRCVDSKTQQVTCFWENEDLKPYEQKANNALKKARNLLDIIGIRYRDVYYTL